MQKKEPTEVSDELSDQRLSKTTAVTHNAFPPSSELNNVLQRMATLEEKVLTLEQYIKDHLLAS